MLLLSRDVCIRKVSEGTDAATFLLLFFHFCAWFLCACHEIIALLLHVLWLFWLCTSHPSTSHAHQQALCIFATHKPANFRILAVCRTHSVIPRSPHRLHRGNPALSQLNSKCCSALQSLNQGRRPRQRRHWTA
jgi:hypothetical protein